MAERIVLMIDIQPLSYLENPTAYITSILTSSKHILLSPHSLSSFKLFSSSLSPSLSSFSLPSLSFSSPHQTLSSLSQSLNSLSSSDSRLSISPSRASHVAGYLTRITRAHNWPKTPSAASGNSISFHSNLVLLFSPVAKLAHWVSEFMNDDEGEDDNANCMGNVESFRRKFYDIFRSVNYAYIKRDIHCSWIDVDFDGAETESVSQFELFKSGVRRLGWGFCSTDSIVLGSALIPFELIYPLFGLTSYYLGLIDNCKPIHTQLTLEILGMEGKPLEGNCCDLELFCLKETQTMTVSDVIKNLRLGDLENKAPELHKQSLNLFDGGIAKIQIKAVQNRNGDTKVDCSSDLIFVRGDYTKETRISSGERSSGFFADRVLEAVSSDDAEFICSKNGPIWQVLLSFLSRNRYQALVSIASEKGDSLMAILKPFTVHLALLSIVNDRHTMETEYKLSKLANIDGKLTKSERVPSGNNLSLVDQEEIRKKWNLYKDLTWTTFRKTAFEFTALELEVAYFARKSNTSKKLKFLRSWIKQVKKSSNSCSTIKDNAESCKQIEINIGTEDDSQQPNPSCAPTEPSRIQDLAAFVPCSETSEAFFNDLPKKIQDGLDFEGVDLQILAERLVNLSIYWLSQKNDTCNIMENEASKVTPDDSYCHMVADLVNVLLKDPKELKDAAKNNGSLFAVSDPNYVRSASENIVREHELQVFLRMEILRSKFGNGIEASTQRKFVKQICALLEIIQYLVEGGFHGDITLYGYIEKTIKIRYFHVLEEVINKIYVRMDLLPLGKEDHSPIFLPNSEDSNHSWRDRGKDESYENYVSSSGENDFSKTEVEYLQENISKDENSRKLSGVQGRREKASRYLQRVWAPKQAKGMPVKSEAIRKHSKRKVRSKRKEDVVCETPNFDKKCDASDRFASISKALFQDD